MVHVNIPQIPRDHGRSVIVDALKAEIIGPDPAGLPLSLNPSPYFPDLESSFGPWVDATTGEEILNDPRIAPMRRFASGVLFPENQTEPEIVLDDAAICLRMSSSCRSIIYLRCCSSHSIMPIPSN